MEEDVEDDVAEREEAYPGDDAVFQPFLSKVRLRG